MRRIALLNSPELPHLGTHLAACSEFINGFIPFDFHAYIANQMNEIVDADIILLSSHGPVTKDKLDNLNAINPNAVYILWYFHKFIDIIPFKKWILTGEHFVYPPQLESHIPLHKINISIPNYCSLMLRVNEDPDKIGTYSKIIKYNGCFMGTTYMPDWVEGLDNIVYYSVENNKLLSDLERKEIYLQSKIGFGFQHPDNIKNHHITQRIFEAMAYGCVVLTPTKAAEDITNGIVVYVSDKADFLNKYNYYLSHPEECEKKIIAGYEWCKKYGTNRYSAQLFLDKIKELNY